MCKQILDQTVFCNNSKKCGIKHCSISHEQTRKGQKFNQNKKQKKIQTKECINDIQTVKIQTQIKSKITSNISSPFIQLNDIIIFQQCHSNAFQNIYQFNYLNLIKVVQNAILLKQVKQNQPSNEKFLLKLCLCDSNQYNNTNLCNLNFSESSITEIYNYVTKLSLLYKNTFPQNIEQNALIQQDNHNQMPNSIQLIDQEDQYNIIVNRVDELIKGFTFTQTPALISRLNQILTHTQNQIKQSSNEINSINLQQLHDEISELIKVIQTLKVKVEDDIQILPTMIQQFEIKKNKSLGIRAIYYNESLMNILAEDKQQLIYEILRNEFPQFYSSDNYFDTMLQILKTIPTDFTENQLIHNYNQISNIQLRQFNDQWINNNHLNLNFYQYKTKNFFLAFQIYSFENQTNVVFTPYQQFIMNSDESQQILQQNMLKIQQQFKEQQVQTSNDLKNYLIKVRDFVNLYYVGKFPEVLNQYVNKEDNAKMLIQCSYKIIQNPENSPNNLTTTCSNESQFSDNQSHANMEF